MNSKLKKYIISSYGLERGDFLYERILTLEELKIGLKKDNKLSENMKLEEITDVDTLMYSLDLGHREKYGERPKVYDDFKISEIDKERVPLNLFEEGKGWIATTDNSDIYLSTHEIFHLLNKDTDKIKRDKYETKLDIIQKDGSINYYALKRGIWDVDITRGNKQLSSFLKKPSKTRNKEKDCGIEL